MIELNKHYEKARRKAKLYMKKGQISAYLNALLEMNHYKKLLTAVASN